MNKSRPIPCESGKRRQDIPFIRENKEVRAEVKLQPDMTQPMPMQMSVPLNNARFFLQCAKEELEKYRLLTPYYSDFDKFVLEKMGKDTVEMCCSIDLVLEDYVREDDIFIDDASKKDHPNPFLLHF